MSNKINKVVNPQKIRVLIRLGQSINAQRWKMGMDVQAQSLMKKYGIRKEDIGIKLDKHDIY